MATVASLWVGGPLGIVQKICLSSFIHYGHKVYLYVYDMDMEVPEGVVKRNAEDIIPQSEVFTYHGQYAGFADVFRYRMIQKENLMWVDADTICLSSYFFEDKDFVFIQESPTIIANGILKVPSDHPLISDLVKASSKTAKSIREIGDSHLPLNTWGSMGPLLLTELTKKYRVAHYAQPAEIVNVWNFAAETVKCWDPKVGGRMFRKAREAICATFFAGGLKMLNFDTNQPLPEDTLIRYFYDKYMNEVDKDKKYLA